jgi:hypothetical protein
MKGEKRQGGSTQWGASFCLLLVFFVACIVYGLLFLAVLFVAATVVVAVVACLSVFHVCVSSFVVGMPCCSLCLWLTDYQLLRCLKTDIS